MKRGSAVVFVAVGLTAAACHRETGGCAQGGRVAIVAPTGPVGYDTAFTVEARALCPEVKAGTISWRQVAGPRVADAVATERGFTLRARTPTLAEAYGGPLPWGVVPLSPRTCGEVVLQATWSDGRGHEERHEARVAAAARSRGLPNLPVGARVYLGGAGWKLEARPQGSAVQLDVAGGATSLLPDQTGDWRLSDGAGRSLTLRTARYDETPLDCGRSGCHGALVTAAAGSPMTTVLARGLSPAMGAAEGGGGGRVGSPSRSAAEGGPPPLFGALFGAGYPDCALACHATGEPGVADGGFTHVMGELGLTTLGPRRWEAVPRALRRLGGVGCLACHGPGALPEASARWSIVRTDVCATCHDAAPRYGHVAAWRSTGMSRADRSGGTGPRCARCHTTWGFLASLGGAEQGGAAAVDRRPPPEVGAVGITCAACHDPHDHATGRVVVAAPLLRRTPRPPVLADVVLLPTADKSLVCLGCHTPGVERGWGSPPASAAALWLGRGGVDPQTGSPLNGAAPHATVAGGCVGCHRAGPAGLERGAGHGFAVDRAACASCHPRGVPGDDVRARAKDLWAAWLARGGGPPPTSDRPPPHAISPNLELKTPSWRAVWNILLVLEDPAAAAHNAPYARLLLSAAERTLNGAGTPPGRP